MLTGKISPQEHILKAHKRSISEGVFQVCGHLHFCEEGISPVVESHEKSKLSFKKMSKKSLVPQGPAYSLQVTMPKKYEKISVNQSLCSKFQGNDSYNIHFINHQVDDSIIKSTRYPITVKQNSHVKVNIVYCPESFSSFVEPINKRIQSMPPLANKETKDDRELFPEMHELKKIESLASFAPKDILTCKQSIYGSSANKQSLNLSSNIQESGNTANFIRKPPPHTQRRKLQTKTTGGYSGFTSMNMQCRSTDLNRQFIPRKRTKREIGEAWRSVRKTQTLRDEPDQDLHQSTVIEDFASLMNKVRENRLEAWDINQQLIQI